MRLAKSSLQLPKDLLDASRPFPAIQPAILISRKRTSTANLANDQMGVESGLAALVTRIQIAAIGWDRPIVTSRDKTGHCFAY